MVIQTTKCVFLAYNLIHSLLPSPGDLPSPGTEPRSPTGQAGSLPAEPPGKPLLVHSSPKLGISWAVRTMKSIFSSLSSVPEKTPWELTLWPHLTVGAGCRRTSHVIRGLELSVLPLIEEEKEIDWRLNQLPLANDLVSHDYIIKPP